MERFWGIVRAEFRMSIQRKGFWLVYVLLFVFYGIDIALMPGEFGLPATSRYKDVVEYAGFMVFFFQLFCPLVTGIAAADRLVRDRKLGTMELLRSTPISRWTYILGKYVGVLAALTAPLLGFLLVADIYSIAAGVPWMVLPYSLLAFATMTFPAFAFVTMCALAFPMIMPLRVFQVLFTGYWFWGNFLSPTAFPTLNGTYLSANGLFALQGIFGASFGQSAPIYTLTDVALNLLVLAACIVIAAVVLERYLAAQARKA